MIESYAVDLSLTSARATIIQAVDLSLTIARLLNFAQAVDIGMTRRAYAPMIGYIAGSGDGLFTLNGTPAVGEILCMDATGSYQFIYRGSSFKNGHWLIDELDPNRTYLVMGRDYNREYEPFAWDYVTPATDLTFEQQQELWQSWRTSP